MEFIRLWNCRQGKISAVQVAKGKIYDTKNGRGPKPFPTKTNGNCIELLEKKRLSELPRHPKWTAPNTVANNNKDEGPREISC